MTVMCAFDIPIHTKNISTRDFALRPDSDVHVSRKERPPAMHAASGILAACMTLWYAMHQSLTAGVHLASCVQFYVSALAPMLLYDHILAPSRSKNVWSLLVLHAGSMLFAYPYDREFVPFRLHALVLVLCLAVMYRQWLQPHNSHYALPLAVICNSTISLGIHAQTPDASFLYYHGSFVLLVAALVAMVYAL